MQTKQIMALAINIEDLLNKQKIESNRIEFKKSWNPASIYHSVCASANDFNDLGSGFILAGPWGDRHIDIDGITTHEFHGLEK